MAQNLQKETSAMKDRQRIEIDQLKQQLEGQYQMAPVPMLPECPMDTQDQTIALLRSQLQERDKQLE